MYVSSSKYLGKHDQQINACTTLWFWKICNNDNIQIKSTRNFYIKNSRMNHEFFDQNTGIKMEKKRKEKNIQENT